MNKKGIELPINAAIIILIALAMAAVIIWAVIFKVIIPASNVAINKLACSGIMGVGNCRAACLDGEQSFPNSFGCEKKPEANICCISLEKGQTVSSYGGNNDNNFEVSALDINTPPAGCTPNPSGTGFGYTCKNVASIKIKVVVYNSGTVALNIFANPSVSQDNGALTYISGSSQLVQKSVQANVVTSDFTLKKGSTYVFTAAGKCTAALCTSPISPNGIFRPSDPPAVMTVVVPN